MQLTSKMIAALLRLYVCEQTRIHFTVANSLSVRGLAEYVCVDGAKENHRSLGGFPEYPMTLTDKGLDIVQSMVKILEEKNW